MVSFSSHHPRALKIIATQNILLMPATFYDNFRPRRQLSNVEQLIMKADVK